MPSILQKMLNRGAGVESQYPVHMSDSGLNNDAPPPFDASSGSSTNSAIPGTQHALPTNGYKCRVQPAKRPSKSQGTKVTVPTADFNDMATSSKSQNQQAGPFLQYTSTCYCGATHLTLRYPSLETRQVLKCNCSLCTTHGLIMLHPPRRDVAFTKGEAALKTYTVGQRRVRFCGTCAVVMVVESTDDAYEDEDTGVNVRTIHNIDLDKLSYFHYDGRVSDQYANTAAASQS